MEWTAMAKKKKNEKQTLYKFIMKTSQKMCSKINWNVILVGCDACEMERI